MIESIAIKVDHLNKHFALPIERHDTLKEKFINIFQRPNEKIIKAVDNVSFSVLQGEFVGIIGANGAGKSTLLKLIAGIYTPDSGTILVKGNISPFLELGVGFQIDLSGKDNIYLYGALLGLEKKEIRTNYKKIIDFAELKKFEDQKLKNYSTGMQMRLAFSITAHLKADIVFIDEVLAVGDDYFQRKCIEKIISLNKSGITMLFVSHQMFKIKTVCKRVIWIENGKILMDDKTYKVLDAYTKKYNPVW